MFLKEPKAEFVKIDLKTTVTTNSGAGGGQYCIASQIDAAYCPGWNGDVDWGAPENPDINNVPNPDINNAPRTMRHR